MADAVGLMPLMRFAKVAKSGVDSDDMDGLVAMYDLLEQCIAPQDWGRFQAHADKVRADGEMLMGVVADVMGRLASRPTRRSSPSSDGPTSTGTSSTDDSYSRVMRRYEGRPDIHLMLMDAQAS